MAIDPKTVDAYKQAVLKADKIAKAQKKIHQSFDEELSKQIPAAIKNNDDEIIVLKLNLLRSTITDIETTLQDTDIAVNWLEEIGWDKEFSAAHHDDIAKVTKIVTDARTALTRQLADARKLENAAKKAFEASYNSKEVATRELGKLDLEIDYRTQKLLALLQKAAHLDAVSLTALEARDSKSLADHQKAMHALGIDNLAEEFKDEDYETVINNFLKRLESGGLEAEALAQIKDSAKELIAHNRGNQNRVKELVDLDKKVLGYAVPEIDVKKAAKALHIDAKSEAALDKVLKGPGAALEKGLDALGKQLKPPTSGRQMIAALKQAGLI